MGSMHTGLEEEKGGMQVAAFYAERAAGEAGLMVTGGLRRTWQGLWRGAGLACRCVIMPSSIEWFPRLFTRKAGAS